MATILELGGDSQAVAKSLTRTMAIGDTRFGTNTNELDSVISRRSAGVMSNLYFRLSANTVTQASTATSRKNQLAGAMTFSIAISTSGEFQDSVNTDTIASGDNFNAQIVTGTTGTSLTLTLVGATFAATNDTVKRFTSSPGGQWPVTTTINFIPLGGGSTANSATTGESRAQSKIGTPGTLQNFYVYSTANAASNASTFTVRVNGANGNGLISVPATQTGAFEDLVNTDVVKVGDLCNYSLITTGTPGSTGFKRLGIEFLSTGSATMQLGANIAANTITANTTNFFPWSGETISNATESTFQGKAQSAYTVSRLSIFLVANTVTATSTLRFRKNAANGNLVISLTASTAGFFEDTTNTDTVVASDETSISLVTGATGTSMTPAILHTTVQANVGLLLPPFYEPSGPAYAPLLVQ